MEMYIYQYDISQNISLVIAGKVHNNEWNYLASYLDIDIYHHKNMVNLRPKGEKAEPGNSFKY